MLTEAQNAMLTALEAYCHLRGATAWVGNQQDLNAIGGQEMLYQLEQDGVVSINRVQEKWIVCPRRDVTINTNLKYQTYFRRDSEEDTVSQDIDPIMNEEDTEPSEESNVCPNCKTEMFEDSGMIRCKTCSFVNW